MSQAWQDRRRRALNPHAGVGIGGAREKVGAMLCIRVHRPEPYA